MKNHFGKILLASTLIVGTLLWIIVGFKAALFALSSFCLLMWINTALTTLGNAMIGRDVDVNYDIFWKILFIILSSAGFGVYFNI